MTQPLLALFDLDGTLVDTIGDLADACNAALTDCGYAAHARDAYRRFVGNGVLTLLQRALPPDCRAEEIARVKARFDVHYSHLYLSTSVPYDGILPALERLSRTGMHLAVLSNKPHRYTASMVKVLFGDLFFVALGQREGIAKKPDPAAALEILGMAGVRPAQAVYIGDSDVDVFTGRNAGMQTIGCAWGFRGAEELRAAGADKLAATPWDLPTLLGEK